MMTPIKKTLLALFIFLMILGMTIPFALMSQVGR